MESSDLDMLYAMYYRKLAKTSVDYTRYLYEKINWKARLIGIKGARGVGKTTLLLQRIKLTFTDVNEAFYVSLDDLWFKTHTLMELVEYLYTHGVTWLFLDEVHRYPDWTQNLKNIYDSYPDMMLVYTGSSMLEIDHSKADLSRRQTVYEMVGFSFREFLGFENILSLQPLSLEELLQRHVALSMDIVSSVKILPVFEKYLQYGYYPFYKDAPEDFWMRLQEVASLVIDTDLPAVEDVEYATIQKAKKMLMILAERVPFTPNMNQLCKELETTRDLAMKLLYAHWIGRLC